MDVNCHADQEHHMTEEKARVVKPAQLVMQVVSQVSSLHATIERREEESCQSRRKRGRLPTHSQGKKEHPVIKV